MLGLPKSTEIIRQLPKKAIYDKFELKSSDRQRFDDNISRITLVNEVSPKTTAIAAGETVKAFFVALVTLKTTDCDPKNMQLLTKLIPQNMLYVLEYDGSTRLAVYRTKLLQAEPEPLTELTVSLVGLNLDDVWHNIVIQISGTTMAEGRTLDEQLAADEERAKLLRRIEQIERQARSERQPRRKWELAEEAKRLKL
ncbi:hypothetical protein AGMMS49957_06350 [Synergistales bacterium]|nr:hypothetical protein AGMMS49957_06350 [Synergistales bacterium]